MSTPSQLNATHAVITGVKADYLRSVIYEENDDTEADIDASSGSGANCDFRRTALCEENDDTEADIDASSGDVEMTDIGGLGALGVLGEFYDHSDVGDSDVGDSDDCSDGAVGEGADSGAVSTDGGSTTAVADRFGMTDANKKRSRADSRDHLLPVVVRTECTSKKLKSHVSDPRVSDINAQPKCEATEPEIAEENISSKEVTQEDPTKEKGECEGSTLVELVALFKKEAQDNLLLKRKIDEKCEQVKNLQEQVQKLVLENEEFSVKFASMDKKMCDAQEALIGVMKEFDLDVEAYNKGDAGLDFAAVIKDLKSKIVKKTLNTPKDALVFDINYIKKEDVKKLEEISQQSLRDDDEKFLLSKLRKLAAEALVELKQSKAALFHRPKALIKPGRVFKHHEALGFGESNRVEFKALTRSNFAAAKYEFIRFAAAAMNASGGNIFFGVDDTGRALGLPLFSRPDPKGKVEPVISMPKDVFTYVHTLYSKDEFIRGLETAFREFVSPTAPMNAFNYSVNNVICPDGNRRIIFEISIAMMPAMYSIKTNAKKILTPHRAGGMTHMDFPTHHDFHIYWRNKQMLFEKAFGQKPDLNVGTEPNASYQNMQHAAGR